MSTTARRSPWLWAVVALGWVSLGLDLYGRGVETGGFGSGVALFLGYFTLWTNILVAVALTAGARGRGGFWTRPANITGVAAGILIVALVYNLVLRADSNLIGSQVVSNELVHVLMPMVFVAYWWRHGRGPGLRLAAASRWFVYPLIYMAYAIVRGAITGWYPYSFADVNVLGYPRVGLNSVIISAAFLLVIALLTWIGRWTFRAA